MYLHWKSSRVGEYKRCEVKGQPGTPDSQSVSRHTLEVLWIDLFNRRKEGPEISEDGGRAFHYVVSSIRAKLGLDSFISTTSLAQSTRPGMYFENSFNTCE